MKGKINHLPYWFHGLLVGLSGIGLFLGVLWRTGELDLPFFPMILSSAISIICIIAAYYMIKDSIMAWLHPDEYNITKGKFNIKNTLMAISAYSGCCVVLVFIFSSFAHERESRYDQYPYHNAETSKGQYEYGGSAEQQKQLRNADFYLTEKEYIQKDEYEKQVNKELGYE